MEYLHEPVMLRECLEALHIRRDGIYVDGTAGLGGHSEAIAKALDGGRLISLDRDEEALASCRKRLAKLPVTLVQSDFRELEQVLDRLHISKVDGVLLDLGVSSLQLDKPERGFSYRNDAPLDMRMDRQNALSADEVVNTWTVEELTRILFDFGEERYARRVAQAIVRARPVATTTALADIVAAAMPAASRREQQHPARRTFQAVRMAVNDELSALKQGLRAAIQRLDHNGAIAVLTFHSLEDREVKTVFHQLARGCVCPPDFPVCVCGQTPQLVGLKSLTAGKEELKRNPRASSARLRSALKQ